MEDTFKDGNNQVPQETAAKAANNQLATDVTGMAQVSSTSGTSKSKSVNTSVFHQNTPDTTVPPDQDIPDRLIPAVHKKCDNNNEFKSSSITPEGVCNSATAKNNESSQHSSNITEDNHNKSNTFLFKNTITPQFKNLLPVQKGKLHNFTFTNHSLPAMSNSELKLLPELEPLRELIVSKPQVFANRICEIGNINFCIQKQSKKRKRAICISQITKKSQEA